MNTLAPRRSKKLCALLILCVASATSLFSQTDSDRKLYEDPHLFQQLSSAKQTLLELKFGKKQSSRPSLQLPKEAFEFLPQGPGIGGSLSSLTNTLVNNAAADATAQDTQSETALVLGSGNVVIAGFNDSGSFSSNNHFTGTSRSSDIGATWNDLGILPNSTDGDAGDPVLARNNTTGTVYLATLAFTNSQNLSFFRSTDNGASWLPPVNSAPGFTTTTGNQDKEWIAVDNFVGAGNGNVYQFWRNFGSPGGMTFTRSTDDGLSWGPSGGLTLASGGQGASVTVGTDHAVYCFWLSGTNILMRKSTDQGVSFAVSTTVTTIASTGTNGDLALNGGFRTNCFPQALVNPANGNIYIVYNDKNGADKADIFFRQSTDGGTTWSSAVKVNDDATTRDQWQPTMAVRPDGTGLSICWYDRRADSDNSLIERWGVIASISGGTVTFGTNFKIGPQFPVVRAVDPVINTTYMGDYDQMTADNSFYYTVWGDNRDQSIAVPARKNANVRFAKYPQAGPGPAIDYVSNALSGGNGNGTVDQNECNNLTITVRNSGTTTATAVSAILSTTTPNVTVTDANSTYPNIASGASAANNTVFRVSTSNSLTCGTVINFRLVVNHSGGSDTSTFSVPSGSLGAPTQFDNNSVVHIPDNNPAGAQVPFTVSGITTAISKVTVSFYLTHTWDGDLHIRLKSPDNTIINLSTRRGSSGDNFGSACSPQGSRTTFDDAAGTAISSGTAPFVGSFRPEQALSLFNGKSGSAVNGTWMITVVDTAGQDSGDVQCASLFLSSTSCTDGGGTCAPVPIQLASFTGRVSGNSSVALEWATISEINNYGFEIQKAETRNETFNTIPGSFVPGHGTTLVPQRYQWSDNNASSQYPFYRLKQIDLDGAANYFDPIQVSLLTDVQTSMLPTEFSLDHNYPNPFNPTTIIKYALPVNSHVTLEIFNSLGQRVVILLDEIREAGFHQTTFDGAALSSGVYIYKITAGSFVDSKKLLLVK